MKNACALFLLLTRLVGDWLPTRRRVLGTIGHEDFKAVPTKFPVVALALIDILVESVRRWKRGAVDGRIVQHFSVHRVVLVVDISTCLQLVVATIRQPLLEDEIRKVLTVARAHHRHLMPSEGVELRGHVALIL